MAGRRGVTGCSRRSSHIGIDRTTGPELTGVQGGRRFESNHDIPVRLPALITNVVTEVARKSLHGQIVICGESVMIGTVDGDHIAVRCEVVAAVERTDQIGRFLLKRCLDFLRNHSATEYSGENVTDRALQLSLETLDNSHGDLSSHLVLGSALFLLEERTSSMNRTRDRERVSARGRRSCMIYVAGR